jgi:hypothetical protein
MNNQEEVPEWLSKLYDIIEGLFILFFNALLLFGSLWTAYELMIFRG